MEFLDSWYGMWFQSVPERIVCAAQDQVIRENRNLKSRCPKLYDEYIEIQTALLLLTMTSVGDLKIDMDGQQVTLRSLSESGAIAYVKKDSITTTISREYHKPELPDGMTASDFPLGRLKDREAHIKKACNSAFITMTGFSSGVSVCGREPVSGVNGGYLIDDGCL